jgi:hypothetical protein
VSDAELQRWIESGLELPIPVRELEEAPHHPRPWHAPAGLDGLKTRGAGEATAAVTAAWINHGAWCAWCVSCPNCDLVVPGQERFVCSFCSNAAEGGRWVRLEWPAKRDVEEAWKILALRPDVSTRNWIPSFESLDVLRAENVEHGLPLPRVALLSRLRGK